MRAASTATPLDDLTGAVLDAGFDEVERVALARGLTAAGFTDQLLSRAVVRLGTGEDREALRRKVLAVVSIYVDDLFDRAALARETAP